MQAITKSTSAIRAIAVPEQLRNIAIIPARAGSRRIPKKNIRPFAGRPMIEYAIDLARDCGLFDQVIVSTDSPEIRDHAKRAGAETPFLRPDGLSDDHTPTAAVVAHALEAVDATNKFDFACCIYPAVPFTTATDLCNGLDQVRVAGVGSVLAVAAFPAPISRAFKKNPDSSMTMIWPDHRDMRTQDLPDAFYDAGQFYWVPVRSFVRDRVLLTDTTRGVVYPPWRAHDIDTEDDWIKAERLFLSLREKAPT